MSKLIPMTRNGKSADVHPDEVENYASAGWIVADGVATDDATDTDTDDDEPLYSVYKIEDGDLADRASRANLTHDEAEAYVAERPQNEYMIIEAD